MSAYPSIDTVELAKQLVSIPSYVDQNHDETKLVDFLLNFFKEYLPTLHVERELLDSTSARSNIIIRGKDTPKLFVLGHIDTVRPKDNWLTKPTTPAIKDDRLYGLGAADMKGSLAAFLSALVDTKNTINMDSLMVLLYCDEEYDFKGIKRFLNTQKLTATPPELIISLDGSLEPSSGCRGLIEFDAKIAGKSGHSSDPRNGNNVIMNVVTAVKNLANSVARYRDDHLGISTINLAYLRGGVMEHENAKAYWQREGNVIPDYADITLEFRSAHKDLDAENAVHLFEQECAKQKLKVEDVQIRHNLQPWPVSYTSDTASFLQKCYSQAGIEFLKTDREYSGFIDVQMIVEKIDSPAFVIGAGGDNKHGANENVPLDSLTAVNRLYRVILIEVIGITNDGRGKKCDKD